MSSVILRETISPLLARMKRTNVLRSWVLDPLEDSELPYALISFLIGPLRCNTLLGATATRLSHSAAPRILPRHLELSFKK